MRAVLALLALAATLVMAPEGMARHARGGGTPGSSGSLFLPAVNNVSTNWGNAGLAVIGGIPTRSTQCGSTVNPTGLLPPQTGDDSDVINAAIQACPTGQYVLLAGPSQTTANVSISGNTLTLNSGTIALRQMIMGAGIHPGTVITAGSGTSWTVSIAPYPGITISNETVTVATVFNITLSKYIYINKGITLRGSGTCNGTNINDSICPSIINVYDGGLPSWIVGTNNGSCGTVSTSFHNCSSGQGAITLSPTTTFNQGWGGCALNNVNPTTSSCGTTLTADAAQGDTSIKVSSVTNFSVGQWVFLDENPVVSSVADPTNPPSGTVQASADFLSTSPSPATMRLAGGDLAGSYSFLSNRVNEEIHLITGIGSVQCPGGTSLTICFDSPLMLAFRQSGGHDARLYWPTLAGVVGNFLSLAGVENLSVTRPGGNEGAVEMIFCAYCWMKGVDVGGWQGSGGGAASILDSARVQIDGIYAHLGYNLINNGNEYPVGFSERTTESLLQNSIVVLGGKGMVGRAAAGNVVAYNYVDQTAYDMLLGGIGDYFQEFGANGSHYAGSHHFLIEGNWSYNCDNDNTHGNNIYMVIFSNWCTGLRSNFTDITANLAVSDTSNIGWINSSGSFVHNNVGLLRAAGPMGWNYWHAYLNNVLGTSGQTTTGNGWAYQIYADHDFGKQTNKGIWASGWIGCCNANSDPNLNGINSTQFLFKNANFDYVTNSIPDAAVGYAHTFPTSLYLSSKPAFFSAGACTYPWPWVTPSAGTKIQTNSCSGSGLPARARFDAGTPFVQP